MHLDTAGYNLDSRLCQAEALWNVTAEAGMKTLVWHWPGSSWPPTSDSPNLHVVDGTQPAAISAGVARVDMEKIVLAKTAIKEVLFKPAATNIPALAASLKTFRKQTIPLMLPPSFPAAL